MFPVPFRTPQPFGRRELTECKYTTKTVVVSTAELLAECELTRYFQLDAAIC